MLRTLKAKKRTENVGFNTEYCQRRLKYEDIHLNGWWVDLSCRLASNHLSLCLQALERFYEAVMQAILRHINFDGKAAV